jgi:hypothetical protein
MAYEVKIKKLPKSEVEIQVSLPTDFLLSARKKAVEMFCASLEIPVSAKAMCRKMLL